MRRRDFLRRAAAGLLTAAVPAGLLEGVAFPTGGIVQATGKIVLDHFSVIELQPDRNGDVVVWTAPVAFASRGTLEHYNRTLRAHERFTRATS